MFDDRHYVPAIRWRKGEYTGLQELRDDQRNNVTPLVDIPPIPWNFESEQPKHDIDRHLRDTPSQMANVWGTQAPIFVDCGFLESGVRMMDREHPVEHLFAKLREQDIQAIPVTGADRDDEYQDAICNVARTDQRGICFRATPDDMELEDLSEVNRKITDGTGLSFRDIDLVMDFRVIDPNQVSLLRRLVVSTINLLPNVHEFRSLTLLASSAPYNMSQIPVGVNAISRADWALWLAVKSANPKRHPSFGDYTALHPDQEEVDPRIIRSAARIIYATDDHWVIVRGRSTRSSKYGKFAQYNPMSRRLQNHPLFEGNGFSWADDYIEACAADGPTGNLMIWKKVAVNRHISVVAHQIANLP
jgi:hypothetical protein